MAGGGGVGFLLDIREKGGGIRGGGGDGKGGGGPWHRRWEHVCGGGGPLNIFFRGRNPHQVEKDPEH